MTRNISIEKKSKIMKVTKTAKWALKEIIYDNIN